MTRFQMPQSKGKELLEALFKNELPDCFDREGSSIYGMFDSIAIELLPSGTKVSVTLDDMSI